MAPILNVAIRCALGCAFALTALARFSSVHAKEFHVLYNFSGGGDGSYPLSPLIRDKAGNLYGATLQGGAGSCYEGAGCGSVFKLAPDGTKTILYSFNGGKSDGAGPNWLILDKSGNFYGTTAAGGGSGCFDNLGCGTAFKLAADGTETVLHAFTGESDGADPTSVMLDRSGNLIGVATEGATQYCDSVGCGVIFKLAPDGTETVLYSFGGKSDGGNPVHGLVRDSDGNYYGATSGGGLSGCYCGTVFKLDGHGNETVLYAFKGGSDGEFPYAGPIMDVAGNFYGTTEGGGDENCDYGLGCGTVFKVAPDGTETILYTFTNTGNNAVPMTGILIGNAGKLYGTTFGAAGGYGGTVFQLATDGAETVLNTFDGSNGGGPLGGMIADKRGRLYGTTSEGGSGGAGTVFEIKE